MEKRRLGRTNMEVTVLGFGAAAMAGESLDKIGKVLNSALDAGINVIDTAECYEGGEESIGNAISKRRDEFFLFTKCGHPRGIGSEDWSSRSILQSIERSLRRAQTDYIDLIQLHGCSETVLKRGEAISTLEKARDRGWVRYLGTAEIITAPVLQSSVKGSMFCKPPSTSPIRNQSRRLFRWRENATSVLSRNDHWPISRGRPDTSRSIPITTNIRNGCEN